jgi:hypothetical protein
MMNGDAGLRKFLFTDKIFIEFTKVCDFGWKCCKYRHSSSSLLERSVSQDNSIKESIRNYNIN